MFIIIYFLVGGAIVGEMMETFFAGRKGELGTVVSAIIGAAGSFTSGILSTYIGFIVLGPGWGRIFPMFGCLIGAALINLLVRLIKGLATK